MIISNSYYNESSQDIIAIAITSNIRGLDYEVVIENKDMIKGNLKKISCIRTDKIYTLSKKYDGENIILLLTVGNNEIVEEIRCQSPTNYTRKC